MRPFGEYAQRAIVRVFAVLRDRLLEGSRPLAEAAWKSKHSKAVPTTYRSHGHGNRENHSVERTPCNADPSSDVHRRSYVLPDYRRSHCIEYSISPVDSSKFSAWTVKPSRW
mgnify:CR=1 FL=1